LNAFPSASTSRLSTPATTSSGPPATTKEATLTLLGLPIHLCDRSDHSLLFAYQKYKAHLEASQTYDHMISNGSWTGNKLSSVDLIELFVSKSFWHSHVKKYLSKVTNHPLMVDWLENGPNKPSNLDVWGVEKPSYNFKDLEAYLEQGARKGKKKAKGVQKEAGQKKKDGHKKAKKQVK
jgi:hypothetical protein